MHHIADNLSNLNLAGQNNNQKNDSQFMGPHFNKSQTLFNNNNQASGQKFFYEPPLFP